jgi:phosphatidylserine decarboxylase
MKKPAIPIALEGYPFIFFSGFVTLIVALLGSHELSLVGVLVTGLVLNFFRDPERVVPEDKNALIAPADGKIIKVQTLYDDKFFQAQVQKISIFMNIFDVHVNRSPFGGKVTRVRFSPGKFFSADSSRAALENEYCAINLDIGGNREIVFVQVAGLLARRIVCWAETGDSLKRGERFGLIRFGSRVDIYLPLDVKITAVVGQKVIAGETILALIPGGTDHERE